jgi:hypothetical protein
VHVSHGVGVALLPQPLLILPLLLPALLLLLLLLRFAEATAAWIS